MVDKVVATPAALELISELKLQYGPELMFHQSGGCCDNSAANCYLPGEITMGAGDVFLGEIGGCRFYIGIAQYEYWKHTQLIIDVIEGHGGTLSLEGPTGKAFHTRSRVFTDEELKELGIERPAPCSTSYLFQLSRRRRAKRTTVTPLRAWRVEGMTSTQSSYGVVTGSPSLLPMTVPAFSITSKPVKGSVKVKPSLFATTGPVTSKAHWRGASL